MPLENQVCSLELAKRLKELVVKQDSYFWWVNPEMTENNVTQLLGYDERFINHHPDLYLSAFSVAELGLLLPCGRNSTKYQTDRWDIYSDETPSYYGH